LGFLVQYVEAVPDHLHVQPVTCHGNVMVRLLEGVSELLICYPI
jgi:hypothetical protein